MGMCGRPMQGHKNPDDPRARAAAHVGGRGARQASAPENLGARIGAASIDGTDWQIHASTADTCEQGRRVWAQQAQAQASTGACTRGTVDSTNNGWGAHAAGRKSLERWARPKSTFPKSTNGTP